MSPTISTGRPLRAPALGLALLALAAPPGLSGQAGPRLDSLAIHFATDPSVAPADTGGRPRAVEYSEGYGRRLAIHRIASYTELPLFATEYWLGEKLRRDERNGLDASGVRTAHGAVAAGLGVLFAVNTVTGVWNLVEARHDPAGRTRRNLHALGMLLADAGFLYTASLAGDAGEFGEFGEGGGGVNRHRNAAIASISVATVSTLMMWLWKD